MIRGVSLNLVEPLIDGGADIKALDDEGKSALRVALEADREEASKLLLNRGAKE